MDFIMIFPYMYVVCFKHVHTITLSCPPPTDTLPLLNSSHSTALFCAL